MNDTTRAMAAIRRGLCKPETAVKYWQDVLSGQEELVQDLQTLLQLIEGMSQDASGLRILQAIAASVCNLTFDRHGVACQVDEDGEFGIVYYEPDDKRDMIYKGLISQ